MNYTINVEYFTGKETKSYVYYLNNINDFEDLFENEVDEDVRFLSDEFENFDLEIQEIKENGSGEFTLDFGLNLNSPYVEIKVTKE
jgi:hypothetical protein